MSLYCSPLREGWTFGVGTAKPSASSVTLIMQQSVKRDLFLYGMGLMADNGNGSHAEAEKNKHLTLNELKLN